MKEGINTEIRHRGRLYHVQTQTGHRPDPVVETLIYESGRVVVRMTASVDALSDKWRVPVTEATRLLALQHWEMIHKIKRGMLDGDDPDAGETAVPSPPTGDTRAPVASPSQTGESPDGEVLVELETELDRILGGGEDAER
jgi:hypothetical protein